MITAFSEGDGGDETVTKMRATASACPGTLLNSIEKLSLSLGRSVLLKYPCTFGETEAVEVK